MRAPLLLAIAAAALNFPGASIVNGEPVKVIGAGLGRTGTYSLKTALQELGYKAYHMKDSVIDGNGLPFWTAVANAPEGEERARAIEGVIDHMAADGYNATTDFPACLIYKELLDRYPDAKVILSVRSTPELWAESALETIARPYFIARSPPASFTSFGRSFEQLSLYMWAGIGLHPAELDRAGLVRAHDAWAERVQREVPPDRLLVHQSKDGWGPICRLLGLEDGAGCPATPFPRVNDREAFSAALSTVEFVARWWIQIAGATGLMLALARCFGARSGKAKRA